MFFLCASEQKFQGVWVGIELDKPLGQHDGTVDGTSYFDCDWGRGILVPVNIKAPNLPLDTPVPVQGNTRPRSRGGPAPASFDYTDAGRPGPAKTRPRSRGQRGSGSAGRGANDARADAWVSQRHRYRSDGSGSGSGATTARERRVSLVRELGYQPARHTKERIRWAKGMPVGGETVLAYSRDSREVVPASVRQRLGTVLRIKLVIDQAEMLVQEGGVILVHRANCFRFPDPPSYPLGKLTQYVLAPSGPELPFSPATVLRALDGGNTYEISFEFAGGQPGVTARIAADKLVRITGEEFRRVAALQADATEIPPELDEAETGFKLRNGVERVLVAFSEDITTSPEGQEVLARIAAFPDTRMVFDTKINISLEEARAYYGREVIGTERERLSRLLASRPCHSAVIEGPKVMLRWLNLVDDCGLVKYAAKAVVHSSLSPSHAVDDVRFFYGKASKAILSSFKIEWPPTVSPRRRQHGDNPAPDPDRIRADGSLTRQAPAGSLLNTLVLAQAHNNGLLYPVWVKEYLGDGIYVTGGTSRLVMLSGESSMINRDNLEIPEGLEDVLPGTKVLARFPNDRETKFVYGPAEVLDAREPEDEDKDPEIDVKFYNGIKGIIAPEDCLILDPALFDYTALVSDVIKVLKSKVGQKCLARRDENGHYALASIISYNHEHDKKSLDQDTWLAGMFKVKFGDGKEADQYAKHVYFLKGHMPGNLMADYEVGHFVLARYSIGDPNSDDPSDQYDIYGPGMVVAIGRADGVPVAGIRFWDDEEDQVNLENVVLGSERMYKMMARYILECADEHDTGVTPGVVQSAIRPASPPLQTEPTVARSHSTAAKNVAVASSGGAPVDVLAMLPTDDAGGGQYTEEFEDDNDTDDTDDDDNDKISETIGDGSDDDRSISDDFGIIH